MGSRKSTYAAAGVDTVKEEQVLHLLKETIEQTYSYPPTRYKPLLPLGYFANVVPVGEIGVAISTDGVGTKILIAQALGKLDTIGIDCVAMNVNDILAVGATPIALVDYMAVRSPDAELIAELATGLREGARLAQIAIPGGEIAQIPEIIAPAKNHGDKKYNGFDLVGTCIGVVSLNKIIIGQHIKEGDAVIGLPSTGIHSNGFTLARRILLGRHGSAESLRTYIPELGCALGEELLRPTKIYVSEVTEILESGIEVKALIHITSDGFLNLSRVDSQTGYVIDNLPDPHPIFRLIQEKGKVGDKEMYKVFNMGIGFCLVVSDRDASAAIHIAQKHGLSARKIGYAVDDSRKTVWLAQKGLVGFNGDFYPSSGSPFSCRD